MSEVDVLELGELVLPILNSLAQAYFKPMREYLVAHPKLIKAVSGFLVRPEKVILYVGKTHLGIEYVGPDHIEELPTDTYAVDVSTFYYPESAEELLKKVVGFDYSDASSHTSLPLPPTIVEDLLWASNVGLDALHELHWNFAAQDFMMVINVLNVTIPKGQFCRIVNGLFFDADGDGLKTRRVQWMDFVPLKYDDSGETYAALEIDFRFYRELVLLDCQYVYPSPKEFDLRKLALVNRFLELAGNTNATEPDITRFLAQPSHQFILSMRFGASKIYSELTCEWQSEKRDAIRPDFFVVQSNGFGDIVEFKLPGLKNDPVVGRMNRESFSSEVNSYISQTRVYRTYFDDPSNREWFETKYGFKVNRPRRILILGRRWDFSVEIWKEIQADYTDVTLMTYDDLVDGVIAQFYI